MSEWRTIESAPECVTVLTQHVEDLYPVPAFRVGKEWLRDAEGPEDTDDGRPGKYGPLYRRPTHWMPIPEGPDPAKAGHQCSKGSDGKWCHFR